MNKENKKQRSKSEIIINLSQHKIQNVNLQDKRNNQNQNQNQINEEEKTRK